MRRKNIIVIFLLLSFSCNRKEEIQLADVVGTYEYTYMDSDPKWNKIKHVIIINTDLTYGHKIFKGDTILVDEQGFCEFNRFIPSIDFLEFTAYNKYLYESLSKRKYFMFMIKQSMLGHIYLTFNWGFDPDGSPSKPKYKKIK